MAVGTTGIVKPSTVNIKDIEILYSYVSDRSVSNNNFTKIASDQLISSVKINQTSNEVIPGLYNLTLPTTIFNNIGIYSILIRPRQIKTQIKDIGVLSALPNVKGIVLDGNSSDFTNDLEKLNNGGLTGFRIEYYNTNGSIVENIFRTVTYSNKAEVVSQNLTNSLNKSIVYRLNDNGSLLFLTVTPSTSSVIKPNDNLFIGSPNQNIIISNTFFDPIFMEIEITEYDLDRIALGIYGTQTISVQDGLTTYYDKDNNIYKQTLFSEIKQEPDITLYGVKEAVKNIDTTKTLDNIINI